MQASIYLSFIFFAIVVGLGLTWRRIQMVLRRTIVGERTAELLQLFLVQQQNCWNFL